VFLRRIEHYITFWVLFELSFTLSHLQGTCSENPLQKKKEEEGFDGFLTSPSQYRTKLSTLKFITKTIHNRIDKHDKRFANAQLKRNESKFKIERLKNPPILLSRPQTAIRSKAPRSFLNQKGNITILSGGRGIYGAGFRAPQVTTFRAVAPSANVSPVQDPPLFTISSPRTIPVSEASSVASPVNNGSKYIIVPRGYPQPNPTKLYSIGNSGKKDNTYFTSAAAPTSIIRTRTAFPPVAPPIVIRTNLPNYIGGSGQATRFMVLPRASMIQRPPNPYGPISANIPLVSQPSIIPRNVLSNPVLPNLNIVSTTSASETTTDKSASTSYSHSFIGPDY